ncbi:MAG: rane protein [Myxococcales bacterium]|nr:rane protein [Myxococcales bacterium]
MSTATIEAGIGGKEETGQATWMLWTGRVLSALPVLGMLVSAAVKLSHQPKMVEVFTGKLGYSESALKGIAALELICVVLYAIPRTAVFGAILLTAYLGGAVATHVRVSDPFSAPIILGVLAWIGLWLREPRLRQLAPLRKG